MKTKLFSAVAVMALVAPAALTLGSASADTVTPAPTSTAKFTVDTTPDPTTGDGQLQLKSVPSFTFGTVKASEIYAGITTAKSAEADGTLEIADMRTGAKGDDWTLSAQMSTFDGAAANIDGTLALSGTVGGTATTATALAGTLDSTATDATTLASKTEDSHGTSTYTLAAADTKVTTVAAPTAKLASEDLTSTITWTLASTNPVAPVAQP